MKKLALALIVLLVAGYAIADEATTIETERISFANETVAQLDTLVASGDSAFSVISLRAKNGSLCEKITVHLPRVLASGDSAQVYLQLLPDEDDAGPLDNPNVQPNSGVPSRYRRSENTRIANSTGTSVFGSLSLGNYYYAASSLGATSLTFSPPDSAVATRGVLVFVETAGAPVKITGMDSVSTSNIFVTKTYKKR